MSYQGHLPNGNPVQQHSAGEIYPLVIMQKGLAPNDRYGILYGGFVYPVADSFDATMQIALKIRRTVALKDYEEALKRWAKQYVECSCEEPAAPDVHGVHVLEVRLDELDDKPECTECNVPDIADIYSAVYDFIEFGALREVDVAGRMLKLSVHDNGMFLKDFRDDRFIFEIYPSMNTEATVTQIMWRLVPNFVCSKVGWRGVVGAWLLHRGEPVMNWQNLAADTWRSGAYQEVKSWQDLCALLNAVTSKD